MVTKAWRPEIKIKFVYTVVELIRHQNNDTNPYYHLIIDSNNYCC